MKLKKMVMALAAGVMALSMVGCGDKTTDTASTDNSANTQTEAIAKITNTEGKLIWATNAEFPPYEYIEDGKVVGIDNEIANYIGEKLGLEVECENMNFDSVLAAVQSGKADLGLAGMTVREDRLQAVNFSDTYVKSSQVIIVRNDSDIANVDGLKDKTVGVQTGTTGDIYVSDEEGVKVERYNKGAEAVQALAQGKIDAVVIDEQPAKAFVEATEGIKILDEKFTDEEYAIAINKKNDELLKKVNEALAEMKENGKLDEIISKYISE